MKKTASILIFLLSCSLGCSQIPDQLFFVSGSPGTSLNSDNPSQVYTSNILKLEGDTLREILTLSDSSQLLRYLRYYPSIASVIAVNERKSSSGSREVEITFLRTNSLEKKVHKVPNQISFDGYEYKLNRFYYGVLIFNSQPSVYLEYFNGLDQVTQKQIFGILRDNQFEIGNVGLKQNLILNGSMAGPFFGSNSDLLELHGHPNKNSLVIPSYLEDDSVFNTIIPKNFVLTPKQYCAAVLINNDQIRLMYYKKGSTGTPFYDLYNKKEDSSYQFPFDNSNLNVKQFGPWIAGPSRLQYVSYSFKGHQPGQENWNPSQSKYGLAVFEYVDQYLKTMNLSGYLAIRNIFNPSVLIEWDTKQGDCEILNIHKEIVYYRKHDELWYVPILKGKKLGEHKMILKDENVTGVHFMFVRSN